MDSTLSSSTIKRWAMETGFSKCGIAACKPLNIAKHRFLESLKMGYHADMNYLDNNLDKRFNPKELLPECNSVIVCLYNYYINMQPDSLYKTARYTWIEDYHVIVKDLLNTVVAKMQAIAPNAHCRVTVDSSCISEKSWAAEAGVGCFGKNGLIHNNDGSFFIIGTILANIVLDNYDLPQESDCGTCRICMDKCPAGALNTPFRVDARRCFAYHTIENKHPDYKILTQSPTLFGCDICQEVCPKNKKKEVNGCAVTKTSLFLHFQNEAYEKLTEEQFKDYFGKTAISRRTYKRFMKAVEARNIENKEDTITLNEHIDILEYAAEVLQEEAAAVQQLTQYLNEDFEKSVLEILHSKGRLVITGIGKSAIIAQKIVATLNSTGTPAVFMHAADAIHGDLGIIQADDVVLCISKSGNTPEISLLVPFLKKNGNTLIAMVGNTQSFLAEEAHFVLNCTVAHEASPNNLAPTCSSTAQLAMGDALASTLIKLRGFTSEDFAKLHPGGILGKRLHLKVGDLYKFNDVPRVAPNAKMQQVILEISGKCLGVTAVVDNNKVIGAITDGDLRRMLEKTPDYSNLLAADVMTKNPKTVRGDTLAVEALELMKTKNITNLFVVDNNDQYLGVIHIHDIIKEGIF